MTKDELLSNKKEWVEFRENLNSPVYFVEMGWSDQDWLCYQKVSIVDRDDNEAVAYFDTGTPVDSDEEVTFNSFRSMCTARFKREHGKNLHNKVMLRPEIYMQLERRLCLDPYQKESVEESTTPNDKS